MALQSVSFSLMIIISLLSLSTAIPPESITSAVDTLSNAGYISMSLTLQLTYQQILTTDRRSATIFSPPDTAFANSGQPSIPLLQLHFVPVAFSYESLHSLPYATKIPTTLPSHSLTVTANSDNIFSLNNVTVLGSPLFDDGTVIVYAVDTFFDPDFILFDQIESPTSTCTSLRDNFPKPYGSFSFHEASRTLRSRGYSIIASFLDLQLLGFLGRPRLTVFAPLDDVMLGQSGNLANYSTVFLRHVVPCKLTWNDLGSVREGTGLRTYLEGFRVNLSRVNDVFMVNEVAVTFPDMYSSNWLVVHGVRQMLSVPSGFEVDDEGAADRDRGGVEYQMGN